MLKLNVNEKRTLKFEVQVGGIDYKQLSGSLKFMIDSIEYGFPAVFKPNLITVEIPPLKEVVLKDLREGETLKAKLEANGNGYYMEPWSGDFLVEAPVEVKATLKDVEESVAKPTLEIISPEEIVETEKEVISEDVEKDIKTESMKVVNNRMKEMGSIVDDCLKRRKTKKVVSESKKGKTKTTPEKPKEVTEKDIYGLMESVGIKKKSTQHSVLERAKALSDSLDSTYDNVSRMVGLKPLDEEETLRRLQKVSK